jgi:Fe-S-cluster containining protein
MEKTPVWYDKGLSFKCTGCGQCCTGSPGYVWVSQEEMQAIADHLNLSLEDFCKKHVRKVGNRLALLERPKSYDCEFLQGNKCQIYSVRPKQCKTFPWWKENVSSPEAWEEAAKRCEGINHPEAPLISLKEIEKDLH